MTSYFFLWESFLRPFSMDSTSSSAAVDVIWGVSVDYSGQTHRAGQKLHNAELLPFMLAQKPKH